MNVDLLDFTQNAVDLLLFTKATRLNMTPSLMSDIRDMAHEEKMKQLDYMADTIPSSWEFVSYTFLLSGVSRAFTHQLVRTRTASYAQQTMRVLEMGEFDYVYPDAIQNDPDAKLVVDGVLKAIKGGYNTLRDLEIAPEDARGVLPTNIATNIVMKADLRTLATLARSRTGGRTQGEYQSMVNEIIDQVLAVHPWAAKFFFTKKRDYFGEIEAFAKREFPDLLKRGELLKIVDKMRAEQ